MTATANDIDGVSELTIANATKANLDIYRGLDCSKPEDIVSYDFDKSKVIPSGLKYPLIYENRYFDWASNQRRPALIDENDDLLLAADKEKFWPANKEGDYVENLNSAYCFKKVVPKRKTPYPDLKTKGEGPTKNKQSKPSR